MADQGINKSVKHDMAYGWINIGRFRLREHNLKTGGITIMLDDGEGGVFNEAELEKVIEDFYAKNF